MNGNQLNQYERYGKVIQKYFELEKNEYLWEEKNLMVVVGPQEKIEKKAFRRREITELKLALLEDFRNKKKEERSISKFNHGYDLALNKKYNEEFIGMYSDYLDKYGQIFVNDQFVTINDGTEECKQRKATLLQKHRVLLEEEKSVDLFFSVQPGTDLDALIDELKKENDEANKLWYFFSKTKNEAVIPLKEKEDICSELKRGFKNGKNEFLLAAQIGSFETEVEKEKNIESLRALFAENRAAARAIINVIKNGKLELLRPMMMNYGPKKEMADDALPELSEKKLDVDAILDGGATLFYFAIEQESYAVADYLLFQMAYKHRNDKNQSKWLWLYAGRNGNETLFKLLKEREMHHKFIDQLFETKREIKMNDKETSQSPSFIVATSREYTPFDMSRLLSLSFESRLNVRILPIVNDSEDGYGFFENEFLKSAREFLESNDLSRDFLMPQQKENYQWSAIYVRLDREKIKGLIKACVYDVDPCGSPTKSVFALTVENAILKTFSEMKEIQVHVSAEQFQRQEKENISGDWVVEIFDSLLKSKGKTLPPKNIDIYARKNKNRDRLNPSRWSFSKKPSSTRSPMDTLSSENLNQGSGKPVNLQDEQEFREINRAFTKEMVELGRLDLLKPFVIDFRSLSERFNQRMKEALEKNLKQKCGRFLIEVIRTQIDKMTDLCRTNSQQKLSKEDGEREENQLTMKFEGDIQENIENIKRFFKENGLSLEFVQQNEGKQNAEQTALDVRLEDFRAELLAKLDKARVYITAGKDLEKLSQETVNEKLAKIIPAVSRKNEKQAASKKTVQMEDLLKIENEEKGNEFLKRKQAFMTILGFFVHRRKISDGTPLALIPRGFQGQH